MSMDDIKMFFLELETIRNPIRINTQDILQWDLELRKISYANNKGKKKQRTEKDVPIRKNMRILGLKENHIYQRILEADIINQKVMEEK